jgi:transglycosylase-like protein with SLT domain
LAGALVGTVVLAAAVSLPTESAQLISALTPPSHRAAPDPRSFVGMYKAAAATCPGLPWAVVAAVGEVESHHGRLTSRSRAGALGPMQFLPGTWKAYATDGDHNGTRDVNNPADAIATAAKLLCVNGGGDRATLATAVWNYNHSWAYVVRVLNVAAQLESARGG